MTGKSTLLALATVLLALAAVPAGAQVAQPLTPEEVRCDEDRLLGLLARSDLLVGPDRESLRAGRNLLNRDVYLLETFGSADGDFAGVAYTSQRSFDLRPERHLRFSAGLQPTALRRNPALPQAPAMHLTRDNLNSDLLAPDTPELLALVIATSADGTAPRPRLEIDSARPQRGIASDTKLAGGLLGIAGPCHGKLTKADLHVFDLLARIVRFQSFLCCGSSSESPTRASYAVLFRGAEAVPIAGGVRATYRMDVYNNFDGRLSVAFDVDLAGDGTPGLAALRVLPVCTQEGQRDCSLFPREITLEVIQPVPAGELWDGENNPAVCGRDPSCTTRVPFSFAERLAGTDWLRVP